MMKTQHFCIIIGHFISNEKIFRFIKLASVTQKRGIFGLVLAIWSLQKKIQVNKTS